MTEPALHDRCDICGDEYGDHFGKVGRCPNSPRTVFQCRATSRPVPAKKKRPFIVSFALSEEEHAELKRLAAKESLSVASYLRQVLRHERHLPSIFISRTREAS